MYIPDIKLHETRTLEEASALMSRYAPDARLLAGGTDLLVDLKTGRMNVDHVVSINRIKDLHGISAGETGLRIGALTTITELGRYPIVQQRFAAILDATKQMAAPQIRNVATVGGNVASAVPCADLPPILTVMNAEVLLWSPSGERKVPMESFFLGPRQTVRHNDEVLIAILVPNQPDHFGAAYARFALRDGNAIAVASVAASLLLQDNNTVSQARIALGAVAPTPKLVEKAGALLVGKLPDEPIFHEAARTTREASEPITDVRGSADFRREMVEVMARRALTAALHRAKGIDQ